jgi:hypothetical protein
MYLIRRREQSVGSHTGSDYYYKKNFIRIKCQLPQEKLIVLKTIGIKLEESLISMASSATNMIIVGAEHIPSDFPGQPQDATDFYTFIDKKHHKALKTIALLKGRTLTDVISFALDLWITANAKG